MSELNKPFVKVSYTDADSFKEKYINYSIGVWGVTDKYDNKLVFIENQDQTTCEMYADGLKVIGGSNSSSSSSVEEVYIGKAEDAPDTAKIIVDPDDDSTTIEVYTKDEVDELIENAGGVKDLKFTCKNTLTNATFSNTATEIDYASEYTNTITLTNNTYQIKSLTITMGGIDITDTAWDSSTKTITISKVTGNIYINGLITNGYAITQNINNAVSSNTETSVEENGSFTTTITVNEGYNLNSIVVTMGGADISTTALSGTTISISKVTADVVITVNTSQITYTVTQGTSDGVTCTAPSSIGYNDTLNITVTVQDGYEIRENRITVTEDGVDKTFTYADGKLTIENVKGNIIYSIDAATTYTVQYVFNNVTSSNTAESITDQDTFITTLSFDTDSFNGIDVTVTMGGGNVTASVYNTNTQTITITNPTGNIIIQGDAVSTITKDLITKIDLMSQTWQFNKLRDVSSETFDTTMMASGYDDSSWDTVSLPYDWSIYNSFNTSTSGNEYESGWLSGGDAIYRTTVTIPADYSGNKVYIHFDGVYMTSEVYINGTSVGTNKNGYIPFSFDITDAVTFGAENTIAVAVSHRVPNSRWYSGAGIYRDCWITCNNVPEIGIEEVVVTTPNLATEAGGTVTTNVKLTAENTTSSDITISEVHAYVFQEWDGIQVGDASITSQTLTASTSSDFSVDVSVSNPTLWTTHDVSDTIRLYTAKVSIKYISNSTEYLVWSDSFIFGYRYITYDADGFYLNGTKTFLKGMCNHHDNGPLGAESYADASERQLRILGDMGCNCLRTTHAPQSSIFMDKAMRMGFMVIEELFDGWRYSKNSNTYDYARFFSAGNSYIEVVVKNTIKRDINNPAVIMWSLGNEVDEGCSTSFNAQYVTDATTINNYIKTYDTTRPTTIGNNKPANTYAMQIMALVDIAGVNYGDDSEYSTLRNATSNGVSFSNKCIYGSETSSPFYTRGIYEVAASSNYYNCFDWSNSEQSNSHASWGDSACVSLKRHTETYDWLAGTMPWTGFDYIGEPTPANSTSVRSSFFGVVDLCGLKKDAYYMYQSRWTTDPMIHIVPEDWTTWNEGSSVTVWVYSNCDSVKLHLNGTEITATATPTTGSHYAYEYTVTYAKGTLVATGYDSSSNIVAQDVRYSAAAAAKGKMIADKTQVRKGGLIYIEGQIQDKYGALVPRAAFETKFTCTGGTILATDNGFEGCFEDMRNDTQTTFTGKCICIVKADGTSSTVTITGTYTGNAAITDTVTVKQGDSNIYDEGETTVSFMDPTNPTVHSSVTAITLSEYSVHIDNGSSYDITVTKTPAGSSDEISATSYINGVTPTVDNSTNIVTLTNTIDDVKGNVTIECGGLQHTVQVACGSASLSTCTLSLNGTEYSTSNNTIYLYEYLPYELTVTGGTVKSVESENTTLLTIDTTNNVMYGKAEGSVNIKVTLTDNTEFLFSMTVETWTDSSSNTITTSGVKSISSNYYLSSISGYTTSTSLSGAIKLIATDTSISSLNLIINIPSSATISSTYLTEFGTDSTGTRKAYIVTFSGTAGSDIEYTLSMTDTENGLHNIQLYDTITNFKYEYKIGTLSCTSITLNTDTINITSDETNNQSLIATVVPATTTDDVEWTSANGYVTIVGGKLFAIKKGTDTVTVTCGDQTASATINISGITEDSTILAYNAEITGDKQYYAGGSSGISWDSTYTLFAELKITKITSTANIISFGSDIGNWNGTHYHIYYPSTTNTTSVGAFTDKTTSGICIAMAQGSSPTTSGVTTTMYGGQEKDTIYLVQNANGLWINGTDATSFAVSSGSFATIQALTTVQIGSQEGSGRFTGKIVQLRCIKTTDLNSTYSTTGLTSTELEEISNNGFDPADYLAIYEETTSVANLLGDTQLSASSSHAAAPITLDEINKMEIGDTASVLFANPHKSNGYILGYNGNTIGLGKGFDNIIDLSNDIYNLINSEESDYYTFTLTKTDNDKFTFALSNGYGPSYENCKLTWSTSLIEYSISDLTEFALSSTSSISDDYYDENCLRLSPTEGYYLNAQGLPSFAKFTTSLNEWSVWYIYKIIK